MTGRKWRAVPPETPCGVPGPYQSVQILSNSNPSVAAFGAVTASNFAADVKTNGLTTFRYRAFQPNGDSAILSSDVSASIQPTEIACNSKPVLWVNLSINASANIIPQNCGFVGPVTRFELVENTSRTSVSWDPGYIRVRARGPGDGGEINYIIYNDNNYTLTRVTARVIENDKSCIDISSGNNGYRWNYDSTNISWCRGS